MGLLDIFRRKAPPAPQRILTRGWLGAQASRLTADLPGGAMGAPNKEVRWALPILRARSRFLAQNDGYTRGFLKLLRRNVVGPSGFALQMRVKNDRGDGQDRNANEQIEAAWAEWTRRGACDVTGRLSFAELCRQAITATARDGECLIRLVRGNRFNRFGLALQLLDPARLDETLNGRPTEARLDAGNTMRMGIEFDEWQRPVAYWLKTLVPNDDSAASGTSARTVRVPAADMLHLYVDDFLEQARGVPWIAAAIRSLAMLDGYSEAELVAAREGANKMGFYKFTDAEDVPAELQEDGTLLQQSEPGAWTLLPRGVEAEPYDPQHPTQAFDAFVKAILRGAAAGTGISYNAFANDAAGLNYSALRATELEDRDEWRTIQGWMVSGACEPIFAAWLREALIVGALGLPEGKFAKFNAPLFIGRGWQWVDPQNEVGAYKEAVALGIRSRTQIVAEQGGDFADTVAELKAEQALMEGLTPAPPPPPATKPKPPEATDAAS